MMRILRRIPYYGSLLVLAYMPFHIFLAQSLSLLTGGLEAWKLGKDILVAVLALFAVCLVWGQHRHTRLFNLLVGLSALYILMHLGVWLLHPDIYRNSALLGTIYNNRLDAFLLLGMGAALLWPGHVKAGFLVRLMLGVSTVVAFLGVAQWFLPHDFLTHFGYSLARGTRAVFYIDNKSGFPRVMATLREPNALGAYLIMPITALIALLIRVKDHNRRLILLGMAGLHVLALALTFSRSAWLAAAVSVALIIGWHHPTKVQMFAKRFGLLAVALVVLVVLGVYSQRHSGFVKSYITHSSTGHNQTELDSNALHQTFIERGLHGMVQQPLGHGPGTAGLASIQNPKGSFLTENYYVQIGYEVGVLGLLVFIAIQALVYLRLWRQRKEILPAVLLTSFWAYVITNMLLHTWSNEAVAAQWWLLAGLSLGIATASSALPKKSPAKSART
jgi:O-antigen ligase